MGRDTLFSVTVDDVNDTIRITPRADLDMATVPGFEQVIKACEQEPASTIVLDLRNVMSLDDRGLHALRQARNRSLGNGHRLLFVEASTSVGRALEITAESASSTTTKATVNPLDLFNDQSA